MESTGHLLDSMTSVKIYFLIWLQLMSSSAAGLYLVSCNGILYDDVYYEKEIVFSTIDQPYNLVFCKASSELFFSHTIRYGNDIDFGITVLDINTNQYKNLDVPGGYAIAYDEIHNEVYLGGHYGIYKYDPDTKRSQYFAERHKSIWGLSIKDKFYYIEYPSQELFVYKNGTFVPANIINMKITTLLVLNKEEILFSTSNALYVLARSLNSTFVLNSNIEVRQIQVDNEGTVHIAASDGMYVRDKTLFNTINMGNTEFKFYYHLKKVIDIEQIFGVAFDNKDQLMFSDKDTIYRLVLGDGKQECSGGMGIENPNAEFNHINGKTIEDDVFM